MKAVQLVEKNGPSSLEVVELPKPEPGPSQVLVRMTSAGVNRAELMATNGHYPVPELPTTLGLEGGGYIESVGSDVKGWQEGDRVSPVHGSFQEKGNGSWAEYCLVESSELVKAPKNLPDEQIGGLWLPYVTAWHGLHHLGNIGDSLVVAIPAASSSVGLAALEICHLIGATAIATTRTPDKVDAICDATKLPKERVIVTDEEKLKDGVKRILGPGGKVDVFFDPIGGDFLQEELECIQRGGTIILYGGLGGRGNILTGVIVMKEVRVLGYHLGMLRRDLDLSNPDNTYAVLVRHFEQKNLKPLPAATFQFIEASAALESLALNKHIGKVYLTF